MRGSIKRIAGTVTCAALALSMIASPAADAKKKASISPKSLTLNIGQSKVVKVKNVKKVKWSVSKKIVSLKAKKATRVTVFAKKSGSAVLKAKAGSKKLTCKITVKAGKKSSLATDKPTVTSSPATEPTATPTTAPTAEPSADPTAEPTAAPTAEPTKEPYVADGVDISWMDKNKPAIAFTFDDGPTKPDQMNTYPTSAGLEIQAALKEAGAHATFFYIGGSIASSEDAYNEVKSAYENGFELGNHSYGYDDLKKFGNVKKPELIEALHKSIDDTNALLTEISGRTKFLFRAPNLATNAVLYREIQMPFIGCAVDSKDYALTDPATATDSIVENVKKAKPGDIVLMHGNYTTSVGTPKAVPILLDYFKEQGIQICSVSELYAFYGAKMYAGAEEQLARVATN